MGKLWIEVCLISARGLRPSSLFNLHWFAVGWIDPDDKYCTGIDMSGTADPVWKTRFSTGVDVSESGLRDLSLQVEVYSREPIFLRESLQGKATIVLKELLDKRDSKSGFSRPVEESGSFELRRTGSDKSRGYVDVGIRVSAEREEPGSLDRGVRKGFDVTDKEDGLSENLSDRADRISLWQRGSDQHGKIVLAHRQAVPEVSENPGRNKTGYSRLISRQAGEADPPEDAGSDLPRIHLVSRQGVKATAEDFGSNRSKNFNLVSRQAAEEALSEDPGCNHARKFVLTPQQAVETLSEDPGRNGPRNFRLISRQALSEDSGSRQPWNSLPTPRQAMETWSEEPEYDRAPEIRPYWLTGGEAGYRHPPWRSNTGYVSRTDNLSGIDDVALAAAAFIFGDDFLSGFEIRGGLGNGRITVSTRDSYCTVFPERTFRQ